MQKQTRTTPRPLIIATLVAATFSLGVGLAVAGPHGQGHRGAMGAGFDKMDADGDGQVTKAEADAFRAARQAGLDANLDGVITYEEQRDHRQAMAEVRARERFARMDTDGDGQVSLAEFNQRKDQWFDRVDSNGDGIISADERKAAGKHRGKRHQRRDER
ncbi:MAG: EF-hand domain-containing protein [Xanthomonadales bacterium]|nr:EF-hand domain-containing protein [Xanthomonadales bacterium]MCB1634128.1 EF-hand domain-containing protein [Xanthomonadales bacterium]MCB1642395.1 EF-hand domain-containing protein [Xanthomonadales bacterium]